MLARVAHAVNTRRGAAVGYHGGHMNLDRVLVVLHFIGLGMGMSVGFANMVMAGVIGRAAPAEKGVLGRFPPAMSKIGVAGLALLWISGIAIVMTRYGGFAILPRTFIYKLIAVVLLTLTVAYIEVLFGRVRKGDTAALGTIQILGRLTGLFSLTAIIFAVITFS
jgi:hypothetical protein